MTTLSRLLLLVPLVTLLAVFSRLASGDPAPAPSRTVQGIATTQNGKPLAHATLYLFGLPPGQTDMITLGDQSTVITDGQGRFTWAVPAALPPLSDYIGVRSIACYALAADRSIAGFRLALRPNEHGTDADQGTRSLLADATRPCETKWMLGGVRPVFSVIVPDTSAVSLAVRGPDGQPLRGRQVQIVPAKSPSVYGGAVVYTVRTDAAGRLSLRCFPGSLRLQVFVPGLGFGSTGTFDAAANRTVLPQMPPLAPFARLSGVVAPALAAPGAFVRLEDFSPENDWYDPQATIDAGGQWTMADVLPGSHRLVVAGGKGESEPVTVTALPGGLISGIVVGPKKPSLETRTAVINLPGAALSVRGRVTDADGRPAVGADVYAVCSSSEEMGGRGAGQKVLAGKTGADGAYLISGLPLGDGQQGTSVHLVAHQAGFGLASGDGQSEKGQISGRWHDIGQDLVLPASHASLTVRVLREARPCPNVLVALAAQGENSVVPAMYHTADRGEAAQALRKLLAPSGQTGPDGAVRFTDLAPGRWDVTANRAAYFNLLDRTPPPPSNVSTGVAVQAGKDQSYTLSLLPPPAEVAFHFAGPNGLPLPAVPQSMSVTTGLHSNYGNISLVPDKEGNGRGHFGAPGLFQITAQAGDRPLNTDALAGPYFEGTALVAVSAATASSQPISVPTRRVGPASIRVCLVDAQGKPLRGTVTIGDPFSSALYAASVDAGGVVVFPNVPLNFFPYTVTAHIAGRPERLVPGRQNGPLPSDAALIAGTGQPLPQIVRVKGGEETLVTFGPEPPGYVRLRLTGPFASQGYNVEGRQSNDEPFTEVHVDPVSGEYLLGPLPAGRRTFHLFRYVPAPVGTNLSAGEVTVTVKAGQVVPATLRPQSTAAQEPLYSAPLWGMVYLADGKTPAWGARAALFLPDWSVPRLMEKTDTQGRLVLKDFWRDPSRSRTAPPGNPSGPVVAAWLPGASGAVIVPFQPGQAMRLVLPPAIAMPGRVTIGGRSVFGLASQFRVRAAYQGKGWLNEALTVEATTQADGTFILAGLTPGTYLVQAARDNIWLSMAQTITVGSGTVVGEALREIRHPEMTLDIAPPGVPVTMSLVDKQGTPRRSQEITIVRPDGPLTEEIWPKRLASDSTGLLRIDGLEAGHHVLTLPGKAKEHFGFDIPAWNATAPAKTERIVLPLAP